MDKEPCSANKTDPTHAETEELQPDTPSKAAEPQKSALPETPKSIPSNAQMETYVPQGEPKVLANEPQSADEILRDFKTRISCQSFSPKEPFPPLLPQEEKNIINVLDHYIKDYRKQTLDICEQIRSADDLFSDHEIQFDSFDTDTENKLGGIKRMLLTTKKEIFKRDKEISKSLQEFEEVYWSSSYSPAFREAYEQRTSSIIDQKLVRSDAVRTTHHLIKQANDTINFHKKDKADQKRARNSWIIAMASSTMAFASLLISREYELSVPAAITFGVIISLRPKRPEKYDVKNRRRMRILGR